MKGPFWHLSFDASVVHLINNLWCISMSKEGVERS